MKETTTVGFVDRVVIEASMKTLALTTVLTLSTASRSVLSRCPSGPPLVAVRTRLIGPMC